MEIQFFHKFSIHRRNINSILDLEVDDGKIVTSQRDLNVVSMKYFSSDFRDPRKNYSIPQLQLIRNYSKFFNPEDSDRIGISLSLYEIKGVLKLFKKYKIPGRDDWAVELFLSFFDLMGFDLCKAMEESRRIERVLMAINETFLALILKKLKT